MKSSTVFSLVSLVLTVLFGCAPNHTPDGSNIPSGDYVYSQPSPTDSLAVSTLATENIIDIEIIGIVKDILDNTYGCIDNLLIARYGALMLEQYFYGYHRGDMHDIRSATKALLTGITIDKREAWGRTYV